MKTRTLLLLLLCPLSTWAQGSEDLASKSEGQEQEVVNLRIEGRGDYVYENQGGKKVVGETGFQGSYLNVVLKGEFAHRFSYAYRQRLNRFNKDMRFFDATDWLYLDYRPIPSVTLSAGKQPIYVGGIEYDLAPIDFYFGSEIWYNIGAYAWGVSAAYDFHGQSDRLVAQVCQSPYDTRATDLYGFNLMWYGQHGFWSTMWSVNAMQSSPGRYIGYLALGNQFRFSRHWDADLDFMNRAGRHQQWLFADYSVIGQLNYRPSEQLRVFVKGSHDANHTHTATDPMVLPGTHITRVGLGGEFLPLKGKYHDWVRLHATYSYSWGRNTNPAGVVLDNEHLLNVGLTCRVDVFKKSSSK